MKTYAVREALDGGSGKTSASRHPCDIFFKQLGVGLFSALTTTSTVGSKISAAEFKISGFSLLLVVPEMCLAGITVKQQEMEPKRKEEKTQNLSFILR